MSGSRVEISSVMDEYTSLLSNNKNIKQTPYVYSSIINTPEEYRRPIEDEASREHMGIYKQYWNNFRFFLYQYGLLLLSIIVLIIATALERVTFKVMIDRMLPYKFVLVELIFLSSSLIFTSIALYKYFRTQEITSNMIKFPHSKIAVIAILDSLQFLGLVYSAVGVSPTMTVILMHTSTLFIVIGSKVAFPNRQYGKLHILGISLISAAITISMFKILWNDYIDSTSGYFSTYASSIYIAASAVQGLSTLYKEKALVDWGQPIDIYYLSSWLFFYQFLATILFSSIFYTFEEFMGEDASMIRGFHFGMMCFMGKTPTEASRDDDTHLYVNCFGSMWLISGYVLATFLVVGSINIVLQYSTQLVARSVSAAILTAFSVLWLYDLKHSKVSPYIFGGSVGFFDVLAILILLVGMEVYSRDPEPDVELITNYPPTPNVVKQEDVQDTTFVPMNTLSKKGHV